jgi:hypothetical protein
MPVLYALSPHALPPNYSPDSSGGCVLWYPGTQEKIPSPPSCGGVLCAAPLRDETAHELRVLHRPLAFSFTGTACPHSTNCQTWRMMLLGSVKGVPILPG